VRASTAPGQVRGRANLGEIPPPRLAVSLSKGALLWLACLPLAACAQDAPDASAADADHRIACAVDGAAEFVRACQVERREIDGATILVVRHPDGGFRRFEVMSDGTGLATADGAERAEVNLREQEIEVAVGTDRYRFPARIMGDGGR
jgi:hypothetical protein